MARKSAVRAFPAVYALSFALACNSATATEDGYPIPLQTSDGWQTASLATVGMHAGPLRSLLDLIAHTDNHMIHSILIIRDQKLVFEEYWPGIDLEPVSLTPVERQFDRETLHYAASVSKSITSASVGIALDQGLIGSVGETLFSFFPEYDDLRNDANSQITLAHLLAFSSGYDWNEHVYGFDDPRDSHNQMFNTADPVGFLLGRPVIATAGSAFLYNSGDTNLLGEIVRRTSASENLVAFADRYLFNPLGIDSFSWIRFPLADHVTFASGGSSLRPRDMAKLGALYLSGGLWNGAQIISTSWVDASTEMSTPLIGDYRTLYGYGYNWWLGRSQYKERTVDYFRASGWGGQDIYAYHELDMIIVFTAGGYYETGPLDVNDLIEHYIFEAIQE